MYKIFIILLCFFSFGLKAQKDSTTYWAATVIGGYKIGNFNFNKRFGNPTAIGVGVNLINSNKIHTLEGTYWFGTSPKNSELLKNTAIEGRYVFNQNNVLIPVRITLQGVAINYVYQGKLDTGIGSGFYAELGGGSYWYKNLILTKESAPNLSAENIKGHDELVIGAKVRIGTAYKNISNTLDANYSFGINYELGVGQNVRRYSYVSQQALPNSVIDGFISLVFNYYFPFNPQPVDYELEGDW